MQVGDLSSIVTMRVTHNGLAAIEHGKVASFRTQGYRRSKVKVAFDPSHMSSY